MKQEKKEIKRENRTVNIRGVKPGGFIYLEHLWRISGLQARQPRPMTALSSCFTLKGQQHINQSAHREKIYLSCRSPKPLMLSAIVRPFIAAEGLI